MNILFRFSPGGGGRGTPRTVLMTARQSGEQLGGGSFQQHLELVTLKEQQEMEQQKAILCTLTPTYLCLQVAQPHLNPTVQCLRQEASNVK